MRARRPFDGRFQKCCAGLKSDFGKLSPRKERRCQGMITKFVWLAPMTGQVASSAEATKNRLAWRQSNCEFGRVAFAQLSRASGGELAPRPGRASTDDSTLDAGLLIKPSHKAGGQVSVADRNRLPGFAFNFMAKIMANMKSQYKIIYIQ